MNWSALIEFTRVQSWVSSSNVTDAQILQYLNIAREKIRVRIEDKVAQDYFRSTFTDDLVSWTASYDLSTIIWWTQYIDDIKRVEVKRNTTDDYYQVVEPMDMWDFENSEDYLASNLTDVEWFFVVRNNAITLFPTPTNNVTDWFKVYTNVTLTPITDATVETAIFPKHPELNERHYLITLWAIPFIERQRNITDKSNVSWDMQIFNSELNDLIQHLNSKYDWIVYWKLPNTLYYQY